MKKLYLYIAALAASFTLISCQEDNLSDESVIYVQTVEQTDFDKWLKKNYVEPYNIDFKYRFEMKESDMNYYTIPADYNSSIIMAHLVKYLCIDTYDEVAGIDFTRAYFPKMFFLIGEFEYRNNGTMILGTAEGGKKIDLTGINHLQWVLDMKKEIMPSALNYFYIKTIHHEFTHILNQTKPFPTDFSQITGTGYVADSWSEEPYNGKEQIDENNPYEYDFTYAYSHGFISDYAQMEDLEDFAEMMSIYITHDQAFWDNALKQAGESAEFITAKLDIVKGYMLDSWNIDLDELRACVLRRMADVNAGKVDLTSIELN